MLETGESGRVPDDAEVGTRGPIVAGYDGSDGSRRAPRHAAALARALDRDLVLVRVADGSLADVFADTPPDREVRSSPAPAGAAP